MAAQGFHAGTAAQLVQALRQCALRQLRIAARDLPAQRTQRQLCIRLLVDGDDVSHDIRSAECAMMASAVSAVPGVRTALVRRQQELASEAGGVVEGRDIGTVVLPDADLKVFLTASPDERAQRRVNDLRDRGEEIDVEAVREQQAHRDRQDTSRGTSPLQVAPGSVVVDTTRLSPDEVVDRMIDELERRREDQLDTSGEYPVRSRNHGS